MNTQHYLDLVTNKKGQFIKLSWTREVKTSAKFRGIVNITKQSQVVAKTGMNYNNMKTVIEKRESGELPEIPQKLPFGVWYKFPWVITHNGNYYARIYGIDNIPAQVQYFINGKMAELNNVIEYLTPSDAKQELETIPKMCFTVKMNDIIQVG